MERYDLLWLLLGANDGLNSRPLTSVLVVCPSILLALVGMGFRLFVYACVFVFETTPTGPLRGTRAECRKGQVGTPAGAGILQNRSS